ncbi:MAG: metallopeptidase family protein [Chloroflexi bacterium]|nr:metallopeptidase family protein [Chloroflexota bacterium]
MRKAAFEALVRDAVEGLPDYFLNIMRNVDFQVRRWPTKSQLKDSHIESDETLLGLYEGYPITTGFDGNMAPPDIITIFQGPTEELCSTDEEIRNQVRETVIHEVAHYFGITDAELEDWGLA